MTRRRRAAAAGLAIAALALLLWPRGVADAAGVAATRPPGPAGERLGGETRPEAERERRAEARADPQPAADERSLLRVRLFGAADARTGVKPLVPGAVHYRAGRGLQAVTLDPAQALLDGPGWRQLGVHTEAAPSGECVLALGAPVDVWLRAQAAAGEPSVGYVRVAAFAGERTVDVDLGDDGRRIHVGVFGADLVGAAADVAVECLDGTQRVVWTGRTGRDGTAVAELDPRREDASEMPELARGTYLVRLRGVAGGDGTRAPVRFARHSGRQERIVALVVPEPTHAVRLHVSADFDPRQLSPTLLLQRLDRPREHVVCGAERLSPGRSELSIDVPGGTYRPVVLPQGSLTIVSDASMLTVGDGPASCQLRLESAPNVRLSLRGLPEDVAPLRVRVVAADDLQESHATRAFLGPLAWQTRTLDVPLGGMRGWIHAQHGARAWLGRFEPRLDGDVAVDLQPAGLLEVVVPIEPGEASASARARAAARRGMIAVVRHGAGEFVRELRRALVATPIGSLPALHAVMPVAAGDVSVRLLDEDGREVDARSCAVQQRSTQMFW